MFQQFNTDQNLAFLTGKIKEIKIAIFKSEMNSELQLPNNIIETLKVDNDGTVWFFTSCIGYQAKNLDKSFYAYLDFYRKGTDGRLKISGKAAIVEDEDPELFSQSNYSKSTANRLVLIKMKIMQAEFMETGKRHLNESWIDRMKNAFSQWFMEPTHKTFDFS